jgi:hypothetical protein
MIPVVWHDNYERGNLTRYDQLVCNLTDSHAFPLVIVETISVNKVKDWITQVDIVEVTGRGVNTVFQWLYQPAGCKLFLCDFTCFGKTGETGWAYLGGGRGLG